MAEWWRLRSERPRDEVHSPIRRRRILDPYARLLADDPDRHAAIMAALERQVDELGPVTR